MTNHPNPEPDFTSPLAGRIEVREPCPWCPDRPMVARTQMDEHVAQAHPDVQVVDATCSECGCHQPMPAFATGGRLTPEQYARLGAEWGHHADAAAVSVPPPAPRADDRAALRDRIAEVLADADGWRWAEGFKEQSPTWQGYQERADAVLAVLPEPADCPQCTERAAVDIDELRRIRYQNLRRAENAEARATAMERAMESTAADALKHRGCHRDLMAQCLRAERAEAEVERLRAMADEAPQPEPEAEPTAEEIARANVLALHQIGEQLAGIESWMWEHLADVREAAKAQPAVSGPCVAGEQQNETPEAEAPTTTKPLLRPTFAARSNDATVDPAMCPRCKGDNQEAFELCAKCAAGVRQDGAQPE